MAEHMLRWMDKSKGDSFFTWDPAKPDEVKTARRIYDDLTGKRYLAYTATGRRHNRRGELLSAFDPELGNINLVPPMAGG